MVEELAEDKEVASFPLVGSSIGGGPISQLGSNDVTAGQNLRSFIACGKSGSFISLICCGIFMFFTADTARAVAAVIPACPTSTAANTTKRQDFFFLLFFVLSLLHISHFVLFCFGKSSSVNARLHFRIVENCACF